MLIGMINLTAFATTSKLEQKQKTEFKTECSFQIEAVNVENDYQVDFVLTRAYFLNNSEVKVFANFINPVAVLNDVGWKIKKQSYQFISYQEKLLKNYNSNTKNQFHSSFNIRSNC